MGATRREFIKIGGVGLGATTFGSSLWGRGGPFPSRQSSPS